MTPYPLRNIPDDLWHRVKVRAMTDGVTVRDVIELGLKVYDTRGLEALVDGGKVARRLPPAARKAAAR